MAEGITRGREIPVMQDIGPAMKRIIPASVACAVLDMVLHAIFAPTWTYDYPASYFIESGLFRPAAAIALLGIFILLGTVFLFIRENLPGSRMSKGARFGIAFGGLWLIGVPGMTIFFGSPILHEIVGGASDCLSLVALGLLLGVLTGTDSPRVTTPRPALAVQVIGIIAFAFIIGQYIAFLFMSKTPYFSITGPATFAWTVVLGLWAGAACWLLRDSPGPARSRAGRALFLGGIVIGINWVLFNFFVLLFVAMPVTDPIILAGCNIASIMAGVFVSPSR